jgi:hypothetical protein
MERSSGSSGQGWSLLSMVMAFSFAFAARRVSMFGRLVVSAAALATVSAIEVEGRRPAGVRRRSVDERSSTGSQRTSAAPD